MKKKPTKWERVLAWLEKKRKDRRKRPSPRRERKPVEQSEPVISLAKLREFWSIPKAPIADKPRFRKPRKWFIAEQMQESWRAGFADRKAKRKAAKYAAYLERTGQTAEQHRTMLKARKP